MTEEIWKDIPEYEGFYQSSNLGRIRSLDRVSKRIRGGKINFCPKKGTILVPSKEGWGYHQVKIQIQGIVNKYKKVHRLIAFAFIYNPENKPHINHKDGNKSNNHVENLEWVTISENMHHAFDTGLNIGSQTGKSGVLHHRSRAVISIKQTAIIEHGSIGECARYFNVDRAAVFNAIKKGFNCQGNKMYYL